MEKYQRYLELRIRTLKRELEAITKATALKDADLDTLALYRSTIRARLSEMDMALEYWMFMKNAKS